MKSLKQRKSISYSKWGYVFLLPFFSVFIVFTLIPLVSTIYYSFFENYMSGLTQIGPTFVGLDNYKTILFETDLPKYAWNTFFIWILGFIPQILISLLLAVWFTSKRLDIKFSSFQDCYIYAELDHGCCLFNALLRSLLQRRPVNNIIVSLGFERFSFMESVGGNRGLIVLMNFLLWFGNTTILIMAGVMGIDDSILEAAQSTGRVGKLSGT